MIAALLLAAAQPTTAIEAERAFLVDAQTLGQWTAFRKWSSDEALMFTPEPVNAHEFLKDRKDPPVSIYWWPGRSYVSCDGTYAVNTGPWVRDAGKAVGYFTTVWQRQPDGSWKWIYDGGNGLKTPRAEGGDIRPQQASCEGQPRIDTAITGTTEAGFSPGGGESADSTLWWSWIVDPAGERTFVAKLWNGRSYDTVINDQIPAPAEVRLSPIVDPSHD